MIAVTGATGQLGRLVIDALLKIVPPAEIVAAVRSPEKAADLTAKGVTVRLADYSRPETLGSALDGVDRLLLISANEVGKRFAQHKAVIDAAKAAGVGFIAYTSILRADRSPLALAKEHAATEEAIAASGIPHAFLRHGSYTENNTASIGAALAHGAVVGSSGDGRIAAAGRKDYAEADARIVAEGTKHAGVAYDMAGDTAFTLAEYAAEVARQSGKPVVYTDLPESAYKDILVGVGLPEPLADALADASAHAADGALFDDGHTLSKLLGRPTTPLAETVAAALKG